MRQIFGKFLLLAIIAGFMPIAIKAADAAAPTEQAGPVAISIQYPNDENMIIGRGEDLYVGWLIEGLGQDVSADMGIWLYGDDRSADEISAKIVTDGYDYDRYVISPTHALGRYWIVLEIDGNEKGGPYAWARSASFEIVLATHIEAVYPEEPGAGMQCRLQGDFQPLFNRVSVQNKDGSQYRDLGLFDDNGGNIYLNFPTTLNNQQYGNGGGGKGIAAGDNAGAPTSSTSWVVSGIYVVNVDNAAGSSSFEVHVSDKRVIFTEPDGGETFLTGLDMPWGVVVEGTEGELLLESRDVPGLTYFLTYLDFGNWNGDNIIPEELPAGTYALTFGNEIDGRWSSENFLIENPVVPTIEITYPKAGTIVWAGGPVNVNYETVGVANPLVFTVESPDGSNSVFIGEDKSVSGSFVWVIPSDWTPGYYRIRVEEETKGAGAQALSGVFTVQQSGPAKGFAMNIDRVQRDDKIKYEVKVNPGNVLSAKSIKKIQDVANHEAKVAEKLAAREAKNNKNMK
ncbi:MAG: hypothetical protein PHV93_00250 [Candidatus Pacebacteria bacterium]|nr:hypothetical protein [Candidatus Paceibacterota bacterium]